MSETLHTVTYRFKLGKEIDNQFTIIKTLRGEVLNASETFVGKTIEDLQLYLIKNLVELESPNRYVYQLLLLGCSWRIYFKTASTPGNSLKEMLGRAFNKNEMKTENSKPGYTVQNLDEVFDWIDSRDELEDGTGDLQVMKIFFHSIAPDEAARHIKNMLIFADWFKSASKTIIGEEESGRLLYYVRLMGFETSNQEI